MRTKQLIIDQSQMGEEAVRKLFVKDWAALKQIDLRKLCDMQVITKLEMKGCSFSSTASPASCKPFD